MPLPTGAFTIDDNTVQSKSYTDIVLSYDGDVRRGRNWQASLAITNLLDTDPPVIPSFDTRFSSQQNRAEQVRHLRAPLPRELRLPF